MAVEKYVSRYAEQKEVKKDKKAILEGVKNRLQAVKLNLKKFKEDEVKELEKAVDEIEGVITDVISNIGVESPAVDTLVDAGKEVAMAAEIADIKVEDVKK
jgi:hypothetical protein